jgi:hypothetical protein
MATSLLGNLTDLQAAQIAIDALYVSVCTNPLDTANALFEEEFSWVQAADGANATAVTSELVLGWMPRRAKLVSAVYVPNTATGLVQSTTLFATLTLSWRAGTTTGGASGALGTAISTLVTSGGTGNWAQWVPVNFTVNAFDPVNNCIPAAGIMTYKSAVASTGTVIPGGTLQARVQFV